MLKKIKIKNFQSHEDTTIELGPGINIFIGENDSGKTSIFRAEELVRTNRPLRNSFIRKNQPNNAEVVIETDTHSITREKGEKTNEYRLSGIKEPYTAFGSNPPEEIVEALNFDEINIQSQLDQPFLVLSSPGQIAQHIRSISGLDIIDKVISLIKSKITTKSDTLSSRKETLKEKEQKLSELEKIDIEEIEALLKHAEILQEENREIIILSSSLNKMIKELLDVEQTWIELPEGIDSILEQATLDCSKFQDTEKQLENLYRLVDELVSLDKEILQTPESIEKIIPEIESAGKQYNNIRERINKLEKFISELSKIEKEEKEMVMILQQEQKELFDLLNQITVCPICTSKLTEETKEKLLENY